MRSVLICCLLIITLGSCKEYQEAYRSDNKVIQPSGKDTVEKIHINPKNFFYLRLAEYFETFEFEQSVDGVARNNEAAARLYKSIHRDSTLKYLNIAEEKYLYLENYDSQNSGRVLYFKSARYLKDESLLAYLRSFNKIHINVTVKVSLGFWFFEPKDSSYHLLLTNGSKKFQVVAKGDQNSICFHQISQPNADEYSLGKDSEQLIKINSVMSVGNDSGLVFYRNLPSKGKAERKFVFSESEQIDSIAFVYRDRELKNIINSKTYIQTQNLGVGVERNNYMRSYVVPFFDRYYFQLNQKILRRPEKEKAIKAMRKG